MAPGGGRPRAGATLPRPAGRPGTARHATAARGPPGGVAQPAGHPAPTDGWSGALAIPERAWRRTDRIRVGQAPRGGIEPPSLVLIQSQAGPASRPTGEWCVRRARCPSLPSRVVRHDARSVDHPPRRRALGTPYVPDHHACGHGHRRSSQHAEDGATSHSHYASIAPDANSAWPCPHHVALVSRYPDS